jgi:hypothetical protein
MHGIEEECIWYFGGKARRIERWVGNIKMDRIEIGCGRRDVIHLTHDRDEGGLL